MALIVLLFFVALLSDASLIAVACRRDRIELSSNTNMTLFGAASFKQGVVSLTNPAGDIHLSAGRAVYAHPLRFLEPGTGAPVSFISSFTFSISPSPTFGDGLAFLITSSPNLSPAVSFPGLLGLYPFPIDQEASTFAVEFDTSLDIPLGDINGNHVAIDVGSIFSATSIDASMAGVDLMAGIPITAIVEYSDADKTVRVWLGYSQFQPSVPLLLAKVDLSPLFHEYMYVGFSASNGPGNALHHISQWSFQTSGTVSIVDDAPLVTPPAAAPEATSPSKPTSGVVWIVAIAAVLLALSMSIPASWLVKKALAKRENRAADTAGPPYLTFGGGFFLSALLGRAPSLVRSISS